MDYHVILIESGKPTHHWLYHDLLQALDQLSRLLRAYIEVNEVCATIIKAGHSERDFNIYQLLESQVIPPDRSELG